VFQDLDKTIEKILDDNDAPAALKAAQVSFITPDKNLPLTGATVDLFLYEVKENRELRDPTPIVEKVGASFVRREPPLRVDCSYIVTTWADPNATGEAKVAEEHLLLAQALRWLSRFPTIPKIYRQGTLANQLYPPPTMVAQMDPNKNAGDFWLALGIPPRPAFYLVVTITMDLNVEVAEGPPVVTKEIRLNGESTFEIGGTVSNDATSAPIVNARVLMLETGRQTATDDLGRFRFNDLAAGNYTLRVSATGFATQDNLIAVPGTVLNEYDVSLTP
jgi:hypothetical protein